MATTPGQRFVRRQNAARSSTSNTTAADITYDTAVLLEGGYSYSSPEVTVDEAGYYLHIFDIGQVQLSGSTRAVGTLVPSINTTDQTRNKATHRYLRNSGGNHGASIGFDIHDLSVNDDVKVRNPGGGVTGTDAVGNYATNAGAGGALQLIRLPDGNFCHVERQSNLGINISYENATRPWIDSTGSWTQITFTNEINDDDAVYGGSGGDLTLKANKKYIIVYIGSFDGTSSQRHVHTVRMEIGGTNVQRASGYCRNGGAEGPPVGGMYLHEVGGTNETLKFFATAEQEDNAVSNTVNCESFVVKLLQLPDSAEWIHVDNGATDSLTTALASTSTWYDMPLSQTFRADGGSNLSLDGANDAVQNDSGASMPVLAIGWQCWDRDLNSNGTRKMPWSRFDNGGAALGYGVGGAFSRGSQGNDDTFLAQFCAAATFNLANGADLSFQVNEPASASNSDMGIYASGNRHFLALQVFDLNSLSVTNREVTGSTEAITVTESAATVNRDRTVSGTTEALAFTENATTVNRERTVTGATEAIEITENGAAVTRGTVADVFTAARSAIARRLAPGRKRILPKRLHAALYVTQVDLEVTGSTEAIEITENAAVVARERVVVGSTEAISVSTNAATVARERNVTGATEAVEITESAATVARDRQVVGATEAITVNENAASVSRTREVAGAVEAITLTENASTVTTGRTVVGTTEAITLTEQAATVNRTREVTAATEAIAITENAAVVARERVVVGSTEAIQITTGVAIITKQEPPRISTRPGLVLRRVAERRRPLPRFKHESLPEANVPRNVVATTEAITVTTNGAAVNRGRDVVGEIETLQVAENAAVVSRSREVVGEIEAITVNENAATVARDRVVAAATEAIQITENQAVVNRARNIVALVEELAIATGGGVINRERTVVSATEAIELVENAATVERGLAALSPDDLTVATSVDATTVGPDADPLSPADLTVSTSLETTEVVQASALTPDSLHVAVTLDTTFAVVPTIQAFHDSTVIVPKRPRTLLVPRET